MLKRWFIEPRPNVFIGTVNARTREKTIKYIRRQAPAIGMLVLYDDDSSQGFAIEVFGDTDRRPVRHCGLHLLAEKWDTTEENQLIDN